MLILACKETESIKIGQDITITITAIQGAQVKIGIDAPKAISVVRS